MKPRLVTGESLMRPEPQSPEPVQSLPVAAQIDFAMSIMQYNQSFANLVDGKANSLLLANSIFLATGVQADLRTLLGIAAVVAAAAAIPLCLLVVYARLVGPMKRERAKLVFFGHIRQRRDRASYLEDFRASAPAEIVEALLKQVYDLAQATERKFHAYRLAQYATVVSAALWIAAVLRPLLGS